MTRLFSVFVCLLLVDCGGGTTGYFSDGAIPHSSACLTGTACASSEKDCAADERCNTSLSPPQCETIYCGANGTVCADDIGDARNLCKSRYCSPAGLCADAPVDMGGTTSDLASDMARCGASNASCSNNTDCCSGHCNGTRGRCAAVGCHTGGGSCSTAADCCSQQCDLDGTCAYELGASCTEQVTCVSGTQCHSGTCAEGAICAYAGKSCVNTSGCCTPTQYYCGGRNDTCLPCVNPGGLPGGSQCNIGSQCCSGSCSTGLCSGTP